MLNVSTYSAWISVCEKGKQQELALGLVVAMAQRGMSKQPWLTLVQRLDQGWREGQAAEVSLGPFRDNDKAKSGACRNHRLLLDQCL